MSIYLSWSVMRLLVVVLLTSVAIYLARNMVGNKKLFAIPYIVVLVLAFNVGERQQNLNRSSFNNNSVEVVDKVEVEVFNSEAVNKKFKESLGDKQHGL